MFFLGGMLVPMAVYFLVNLSFGATGCMSALTVPMATDIAFAGAKKHTRALTFENFIA